MKNRESNSKIWQKPIENYRYHLSSSEKSISLLSIQCLFNIIMQKRHKFTHKYIFKQSKIVIFANEISNKHNKK